MTSFGMNRLLSGDRLRGSSLVVGCLVVALGGCYTPAKERALKNDIFAIQTRMLQLEQQLVDGTKESAATGEVAKRSIASTSSEIERLSKELQRTRGDIDALKIGVTTGQMPGQETAAEGSLASQIADIKERLAAVEQQQADLIAAMEANAKKGPAAKGKGDDKAKGAKVNDKSGSEVATAAQIKALFEKKKYKQVAEDGPKVLKGAKGKDKEELNYMVAESLYRAGKLRDAALQFNQLLESNPSEKYIPLAKMRMGDSFRHLGDKSTAKIYYEELIAKFPESEEAAKAKERLAELGGSPAGGEKQGSAVKSTTQKKVARATNR